MATLRLKRYRYTSQFCLLCNKVSNEIDGGQKRVIVSREDNVLDLVHSVFLVSQFNFPAEISVY